jgi:enoyl-CoA hydratase/carnithine racemase
VLAERIETHDTTVPVRRACLLSASMSWLHVESSENVRRIVIDRPERKNAIPADGWPLLTEAFVDFENSDDRVLVITGAGGEFCAGADLDPERFDGTTAIADGHRRMKLVERAATALHRCTKPTIAAVDGVAVGAGMNLALGCDVVIASDRARFSEIFVRRGLTVDFGGTWLLPRIVGLQRAKELVLSGRIVGAEEALALGLCIEVVAAGELEERANQLADSFLAGAPIAQMFAKQGVDAAFESSFFESISWEGQSQSIAFGTEDVIEGVAAFLQKRDPQWRGR